MSKSGFSTLHRWLGRKNKDKTMENGKLSKSNTNLSISSTNINETSQLEYNRITPLPAATTNAPFEQTFRITVLLPKDQLYVTRLGARVPLSKLLELVCDNKLLDEEKYEFRNPVDPSQVYSCDLTIGAVGLSEVRLCHKSESYDNFNSDEIIKLHRTSLIRESLSSSEFSSRNSKHTTKTTSPYSSTNSLNSMDSSAVSCGRSAKCQTKILAPPRKKRAAPRPPSQTVIPEKPPLSVEEDVKPKPESPLAAKDFSISTPNLASSTILHSDINGNDCNDNLEDFNDLSSGNGSLNSNGYAEDTVLYAQVQKKNALNSQSTQNLEESCTEIDGTLPEPSPRKRIVVVKKKTIAPPAPPPRNSLYQDDAVSIASTNVSSNSTPTTLLDVTKTPLNGHEHVKGDEKEQTAITNSNLPKPLPRITTTTTTLLNATDIEEDLKQITDNNSEEEPKAKPNISKVLLNRTPTPEPRSLSCEPPEHEHCYETQLEQFKQQTTEEDCVSKQADSGIGEPVPSPLPDSLPSDVSNLNVKINHFESSSDDDDMVKVYNFKLGKTLVKPVSETKTLEELTVMNNVQEETDSEISTPLILAHENTPNTLSETSSWNFAIPISPPPNFADTKFMDDLPKDPQPDTPITPKILERPVLNFEILKQEDEGQQEMKEIQETPKEKYQPAPKTPLENIVQELANVILDKGVDSLIKKSEEPAEIEAAKPNTLSNFTINAIQPSSSDNHKPKEALNVNLPTETSITTLTDFAKVSPSLSNSTSSTSDEEKLYRKRSSVSSLKQRRSVTRSDSFHTTAALNESTSLNKRTSSQLSLDQMASNLNRRRSSSELSIAESPSLQSLEIIKTILNSRKNSLANSSEEEDKEIEINARRPSEELKYASLDLKTAKSTEKCQREETKLEENKIDVKEEKPKELPKIYRYSGPPSINFSTWNERPKSQVAIKNEGDYIFGGAKNMNATKNYRLSTPNYRNDPPPVAPKPGAIERMGIPDKDYKVPILVKPLKDVVVVGEKTPPTQKEVLKTSETFNNRPHFNGELTVVQNTQYNTQRPTVESALRPRTQISLNTLPHNTQRPTVEEVLRPQTQTIVNTSTLPRVTKQRYSTPSAVPAGPQLLRSFSTKQQPETDKLSSNKVTLPGPQILRSSSIKQAEMEKSSATGGQTSQAPFGQNTLRRTGFKEKILAKEEQEKQIAITPVQATLQQKLVPNGDLKPQTNQKFNNSTTTSAKLQLNLKKSNTSITKINSPPAVFPSAISASNVPVSLEASTLKLKPTTPKTAPVLTNTTNSFSLYAHTTNSLPPTPPAMTIQLKPTTMVRTATSPDDPRDELLAAIRNFNKDGLKKA